MRASLALAGIVAALGAAPAAVAQLAPPSPSPGQQTPTLPQRKSSPPTRQPGVVVNPGALQPLMRVSAVSTGDAIVFPAGTMRFFDVQVTVENVPAGAQVSYQASSGFPRAVEDPAAARLTAPCRWTPEFSDGPYFTPDSSGRAVFNLRASFHLDDGSNPPVGYTGPCQGLLRLATRTGNNDPVFRALVIPPMRLKPRTAYRIENTWSLQQLLKFDMQTETIGVCKGVSLGLSGAIEVGPHEDGGDIVIDIRSGPLGTTCRAVAPPALMDDRLELTSIDWEVVKTGDKCDIGEAMLPGGAVRDGGVYAPGLIPSEDVGRYTGNPDRTLMSFLRISAPTLAQGKAYLGPMHVRMACRETLSNDHAVRVRLRSVTFVGPPGLSVP